MPYLSHHAVPDAINLLPVFPIGDQVEVVGEAHDPGQALEDVDAEALAALLHRGHPLLKGTENPEERERRVTILNGGIGKERGENYKQTKKQGEWKVKRRKPTESGCGELQ